MRGFLSCLILIGLPVLVFSGPIYMGCAFTGWQPLTDTDFHEGDNGADVGGGGGSDVLELPFFFGDAHVCTQGVGGGYSHNGNSTYYALDFDTSNVSDEEVFAPVSGVARVHLDTSQTGFGYHVNIDRGDGTYVVVAHLFEIFVLDHDQVVAGQLIGFEGCTGNCTGDHVHIDLHEGDASLAAEYGVSVPARYAVRDEAGEAVTLASDEFVCDLYGGRAYESELATVVWHPDGTLLKYPASPDVFVVDKNELAWFEDEEVFWSYNFEFSDVVAMSEREFSCMGEGSVLLDEPVEYRAVTDDEGTTWIAYEREDDPGRYRKAIHNKLVEAVVESWGIPGILTLYSEEAAEILERYPEAPGNARLRDGTLVTEEGSSDVFVVHEGVALPIESWDVFVILGFEHRGIITIPENTLEYGVLDVGSCVTGIGCVTMEVVTSCGSGIDIDVPDDVADVDDDDADDDTADDDDADDDADDDIADDDDADDDDTGDDDDDDTAPLSKMLEVIGRTSVTADYIWLQGELLDENDSPSSGGFWWASLEYQPNTDEVTYVATVDSDWTFRYSFEYEINGVTGWSCVAPYPPGTLTMDLEAYVDGVPVTVNAVDNFLGGCELFVEVPL